MPGYHLPYFTAAANSIYEKHGLDVEIVYPEPGPENIRAVADGRYDVCLTSVAHFLNARRSDLDLGAKFVFMIARHTHMAAFFIRGRPASHGRMIETFQDLDGASLLGDDDTPFTREYLSLLRQLGLSPGAAVEIAYPEVMDGLAAGKGDVTADFLDLLPAFESPARGFELEVGALPFYQAGLDIYGSGLVAGTRLIEGRPRVIHRTVAAIREALVATKGDPAPGLAEMSKQFPEVDRERALGGWAAGESLIFTDGDEASIGAMEAAKWQRTIDHHADIHGTPRVAPESVFDDSSLR